MPTMTLHTATLPGFESNPFNIRLRDFRDSRGETRTTLAAKLGVSAITLYRWETGSAKPSPLAAEKLSALGFGNVKSDETNTNSISRLKSSSPKSELAHGARELRKSGLKTFKTKRGPVAFLPSPFVRNGPPDQNSFHNRMLELQLLESSLPREDLFRRLSMVEELMGSLPPAQHLLEEPKATAMAWNSNYGSHGWHRYVGRFPPHVVRALLNYFGADSTKVVCDPFVGSGTTAVECRLLGIPFVGIEICPLSCLMARTKASFPDDPQILVTTERNYADFYKNRWKEFLAGRSVSEITHSEILARNGNPVPPFTNLERWFTPEALLGVSITVEFGLKLKGFARDASLLALSSKMRSIGNVDVDVVRAEYSKQPRENVDVGRLVSRQLKKMSADIARSILSHTGLIDSGGSIRLLEASVLEVTLPEGSIDYVITSPPYGVEAISYLRTHLLSYRSLAALLKHDPYDSRDKTIGSEYLPKTSAQNAARIEAASATCRRFCRSTSEQKDKKDESRRTAMIQFFDDMLSVGEKLGKWVKDDGKVAFSVGNKRLGDEIIPIDIIVSELFANCGFVLVDAIRHKLKTNNSNSQVPWQEKIIQEESILIFSRQRRVS